MLSKLTKKIFSCPQCTQKLRIPIKPGKTLRITCHKCKAQFDVNFKSPIFDLLSWEKGRTLKYNIEGFKLRFKAMPIKEKVGIFLSFLIFVVLFNLVILTAGSFLNKKFNSNTPELNLPESSEHFEVI
jgi:hypothetical protein